jgi:hypothetical protein
MNLSKLHNLIYKNVELGLKNQGMTNKSANPMLIQTFQKGKIWI